MSRDIVAFEATLGETTDLITRTGLIFECGAYPERNFALTEAEADAVIAAFAPVPLELEHFDSQGQPHIFTGRLGQLTRLWREDTRLLGTVQVPPWVDGPWSDYGRKVSAAWDRATKQLVRCGLVLRPHIGHAALMAAFAEQVELGAPAPQPKESQRMSWMEELRALFARPDAPVQLVESPPAASDPPVPTPPPAPVADFSAREAEIATRERQLAADRATFAQQQYWAQAERDVDALITSGRILPAQDQPNAQGQRTYVAFAAQLLADDATATALFGQAGGSRYATWLAAMQASAPQVPLGENLPVVTLSTGPDKAPVDEAARDAELLSKSSVGQLALARQQKERSNHAYHGN